MTPLPGPPREYEIVERVLSQVRSKSRAPILVSGPIGSGKTWSVERATAILRSQGLTVGGVLALRVLRGAQTIGYRVRDLADGGEQDLAALQPPGVPIGRFFLSPDGLAFARRAIDRAIGTSDVVVVDEIGRLELAGEGHAKSVRDAITSSAVPLLVVRDDFVDDVIRSFSLSSAIVVHVGPNEAVDDAQPAPRAVPAILWDIVDSISFPLLVTQGSDGYPHSRPMRVLERDGTAIWFATSRASTKVHQIATDSHVALLFVDSRRFNYVCLHGRAAVVDDEKHAAALWRDDWRDDWPDGPDDPDFAILRIDAVSAHYTRGFTAETGSVDL